MTSLWHDRTRTLLVAAVVALVGVALFLRPASLPSSGVVSGPIVDRPAMAGRTYSLDVIESRGRSMLIGDGSKPFPVAAGADVFVTGWVIDPRTLVPAHELRFLLDRRSYLVGTYGMPRPDVAATLGLPNASMSGFRVGISMKGLAPGMHQIRFTISGSDDRSIDLPTPIRLSVGGA